jgi:hypothetical protein
VRDYISIVFVLNYIHIVPRMETDIATEDILYTIDLSEVPHIFCHDWGITKVTGIVRFVFHRFAG